jgi:hypothetical protein
MRTSVYGPDSSDESDEFPGCYGQVSEHGTLDVVDYESSCVEATYEPHEWSSFDVVNDDRE